MTSLDQMVAQNTTKLKLLQDDYRLLMEEIGLTPPNPEEVQFQLQYFNVQVTSYCSFLQQLIRELLKAGKTDEYEVEEKRYNEWTRKRIQAEIRANKIIPQITSGTSTSIPDFRMNLPKRELPKFGGDVRQWLAFWATFSEIHSDTSIPETQKFHYLIQSTIPDTPARLLVTSFPVCADNYSVAVKSLRERFGRDSMLVKVYVRDLLKLVVDNSSGKCTDFIGLVTQITSQIRNLETLGVTQDKCEQILYPVVESCVPDDVLIAWQRHPTFEEKLDKLISFLQSEVNNKTERYLAQSQFSPGQPSKISTTTPKIEKKRDIATASSLLNNTPSDKVSTCAFCDGSHDSATCCKATTMTLDERRAMVKKRGRCSICLRGHAKKCNAFVKCIVCKRRHHTIMCPELEDKRSGESEPSNTQAHNESEQVTCSTNMMNKTYNPEVPLQTLYVKLHGANGQTKVARAVVDPGSQRSYVRSQLAKQLQFEKVGEETCTHSLFGGSTTAAKTYDRVKIFISSLNGSNNCNFDVSCIGHISKISPIIKGPWIEDFYKKGVTFTDTNHDMPQDIEVLIGNDVATRLATGRKVELPYGPVAVEYLWGWVLSGKLPLPARKSFGSLMVTSLLTMDQSIPELWRLETIGIMDSATRQTREEMEKETQLHFEQTVSRLPDGRYEVHLPFVSGLQKALPTNFEIAERRLISTTKTLKKEGYFNDYDKLLEEWKLSQMIEEIPMDNSDISHYLPHRAVVKLSSSTTPIRPVFDASAKAKGKYSLNECLDKGPNTLELIPAILTRFRKYQVGVTSDVKKAFQQISIIPTHRDYLRFLWWKDDTCKQLKVYRHKRVVFGVTSSPYLLGATLKYHLHRSPESYKHTAEQLVNSLYVDNCLCSVPSTEEALQFKRECDQLLLPAKFELRGWEIGPVQQEEKTIPALGLLWNMKRDTLELDLSSALTKMDGEHSSRNILSLVHSIYDPLGFASPFILQAKLMMRECHTLKLGWDKPLPKELDKECQKWKKQVPLLPALQIPRHLFLDDKPVTTLHVFADASKYAYAAAVFIKAESGENPKIQLLYSKSRVAPKDTTITRLELLACLIAARLANTVKYDLDLGNISTIYWSDSTTALTWIRSPGPWATFVNNRVEEIRQLTKPSEWKHVPGVINPADLPSRGCSAPKLLESQWWLGPKWLYSDSHTWPQEKTEIDMQLVESEKRKTVVSQLNKENSSTVYPLLRLSDYHKVVRVIALAQRYVSNLKMNVINKVPRKLSKVSQIAPLSLEEINNSETFILQEIQLQLHEKIDKLKKLQPYLDDKGIYRIRTRILNEDNNDFLNPILLPDDDEIVKLIIRKEHEINNHAGTQILLSILREKFWVLNGRRTVRKVVNTCAKCRRFTARKLETPEAPLPVCRTSLTPPFSVVGVDMAGPLILKGGNKCWIALFTCAVYRAIHLEVTCTLSTEGFLQTFRRFVSRRGRPTIVYSDNGLNFVGAAKFLKKIDWSEVIRITAVSKIDWRFNPPTASWWGGFWERLVGLTKDLLRRTLGNRVVHLEELTTILTEVEETLNNRPLTYLSEAVDDLAPLTPNTFLRSNTAAGLPEADAADPDKLRSALKKLQHLRRALASRFRLEYLGQLVQFHHVKQSKSLKPGDIVLIENDNQKRLDWPIGRITEAIPGKDGAFRAYHVMTKNGILLRPAQRLIPLEYVNSQN